jgi:hypothetical protein
MEGEGTASRHIAPDSLTALVALCEAATRRSDR